MQVVVLNFATIPIFGTPLALTIFTICFIGLAFGLRLWLNRSRWRAELCSIGAMVPILGGLWYLLYRFPIAPPIAITDSLHLALSVALLALGISLLLITVNYRFDRKLKVTPRYVQGMFWVLIIGILSNTFVFR